MDSTGLKGAAPATAANDSPSTKWKYPTRDELRARYAHMLVELMGRPDEAMFSVYVYCALEDISVASGWRNIKEGRWPKPMKSGSHARIRLGEYRRLRGLNAPVKTSGARRTQATEAEAA